MPTLKFLQAWNCIRDLSADGNQNESSTHTVEVSRGTAQLSDNTCIIMLQDK